MDEQSEWAKKYPASAAWDKHSEHWNGHDKPSVTVWYPMEMPYARLKTLNNGCQEPETLPSGPAVVYVNISGVQFGGPLDDIELLFDAVREQIGITRSYYEELKKVELQSRSKGDENK